MARDGRKRTAIALTALLALACTPALHAEEPIWTDKPVRIDRKAQTYERVAVERRVAPLRLRVTPYVTVFDSASFREGGRIYVLTGAVAVDPKRLCRGAGGRISACGQQARLYLKRLITNRSLACREDHRERAFSFVTCTLDDKDIATTLVEKGAAWAAIPALAARQADAVSRAAGIWTDAECRAAGRCLPQKRRR